MVPERHIILPTSPECHEAIFYAWCGRSRVDWRHRGAKHPAKCALWRFWALGRTSPAIIASHRKSDNRHQSLLIVACQKWGDQTDLLVWRKSCYCSQSRAWLPILLTKSGNCGWLALAFDYESARNRENWRKVFSVQNAPRLRKLEKVENMTTQMKLRPQQLADWQCIRGIGEIGMGLVVAEVRKLPISPVQPKELQGVISKALDGRSKDADVLLRQLLSLHGIRRQLDLTSEEIFAGLDSGLLEAGVGETEFKKWESVSPAFKELFELPAVRISAKGLDLSYQHSHLMQRVQIITDVRPIFNSEADEIQGTLISHKLMIRYDDLEGEHALSLAVDDRDIKALIRQCERAFKKSELVKAQLDKAGLRTLIPGKD